MGLESKTWSRYGRNSSRATIKTTQLGSNFGGEQPACFLLVLILWSGRSLRLKSGMKRILREHVVLEDGSDA